MNIEEEYVQVVVRIRPMQANEKKNGDIPCVKAVNNGREVQVKVGPLEAQTYRCHKCFNADTPQANFFGECGITDLLDSAMNGYHACIFAFGQTGAGKTYTMLGPTKGLNAHDKHIGLIARSLSYLYEKFVTLGAKFRIKVTCLEIYHEHVYDLFTEENNRTSLPVREHTTEGFFLDGCKYIECATYEQACVQLNSALKTRQVGGHELNSRSSRSHCITEIYIELFQHTPRSSVNSVAGSAPSSAPYISMNGTSNYVPGHMVVTPGEEQPMLRGKVSLVDLAGSERLKNTNSTGKVLQEAGFINRSLYVLGKVIAGLVRTNGDINSKDVPYRDSKLTKLLIQCLSGQSRTLLLACVSEAKGSQQETLRTLKFSMSCARIRNKPVKFLDPQEKLILDLKSEIKRLRVENCELRNHLVTAPSSTSLSLDGVDMGGGYFGADGGSPRPVMARARSVGGVGGLPSPIKKVAVRPVLGGVGSGGSHNPYKKPTAKGKKSDEKKLKKEKLSNYQKSLLAQYPQLHKMLAHVAVNGNSHQAQLIAGEVAQQLQQPQKNENEKELKNGSPRQGRIRPKYKSVLGQQGNPNNTDSAPSSSSQDQITKKAHHKPSSSSPIHHHQQSPTVPAPPTAHEQLELLDEIIHRKAQGPQIFKEATSPIPLMRDTRLKEYHPAENYTKSMEAKKLYMLAAAIAAAEEQSMKERDKKEGIRFPSINPHEQEATAGGKYDKEIASTQDNEDSPPHAHSGAQQLQQGKQQAMGHGGKGNKKPPLSKGNNNGARKQQQPPSKPNKISPYLAHLQPKQPVKKKDSSPTEEASKSIAVSTSQPNQDNNAGRKLKKDKKTMAVEDEMSNEDIEDLLNGFLPPIQHTNNNVKSNHQSNNSQQPPTKKAAPSQQPPQKQAANSQPQSSSQATNSKDQNLPNIPINKKTGNKKTVTYAPSAVSENNNANKKRVTNEKVEYYTTPIFENIEKELEALENAFTITHSQSFVEDDDDESNIPRKDKNGIEVENGDDDDDLFSASESGHNSKKDTKRRDDQSSSPLHDSEENIDSLISQAYSFHSQSGKDKSSKKQSLKDSVSGSGKSLNSVADTSSSFIELPAIALPYIQDDETTDNEYHQASGSNKKSSSSKKLLPGGSSSLLFPAHSTTNLAANASSTKRLHEQLQALETAIVEKRMEMEDYPGDVTKELEDHVQSLQYQTHEMKVELAKLTGNYDYSKKPSTSYSTGSNDYYADEGFDFEDEEDPEEARPETMTTEESPTTFKHKPTSTGSKSPYAKSSTSMKNNYQDDKKHSHDAYEQEEFDAVSTGTTNHYQSTTNSIPYTTTTLTAPHSLTSTMNTTTSSVASEHNNATVSPSKVHTSPPKVLRKSLSKKSGVLPTASATNGGGEEEESYNNDEFDEFEED